MTTHWMPKNGFIIACAYCGEQIYSGKYCKACKTQAGRKEIFNQNAEIFKANAKLGYTVPTEIRSWK